MATQVVFAVNGERCEATSGLDTSLADYLRQRTQVRSVKLGCREGGCGACAVEVARYNVATGDVEITSLNSCLAPIGTLDGVAVTTAEGIGNSRTGFHDLQEAVAVHHGSQCGFCTPGFVVACHAALQQAKAAGVDPTPESLQTALDGNLCRCTGYRPILDACKTFAGAGDIEDLGFVKVGSTNGEAAAADVGFPDFLKQYLEEKDLAANSWKWSIAGLMGLDRGDGAAPAAAASGGGAVVSAAGSAEPQWLNPTSLAELFSLMHSHKGARLVAGNTGAGVYKNWPHVPCVINVQRVAEFRAVTEDKDALELGAAVTIAETIQLLRASPAGRAGQPWAALAAHLERIAGSHVRGAATLGGHFVLARERGLESDGLTTLLAAGAAVTVATKSGSKTMSLEQFMDPATHLELGTKHVISAVSIPLPRPGEVFWSHKVAERYYNAKSLINAAIWLRMDDGTVADARIVVGAHRPDETEGRWRASRIAEAERALVGKSMGIEGLVTALEAVTTDLKAAGSFGASAAEGLVFEALSALISKEEADKARGLLAATSFGPPPPVEGSQAFPDYSTLAPPVYQPIQKDRVRLQASGEALYSGDMIGAGTLFGTFVLSTEALAVLSALDPAPALAEPGVRAFFGAADVPAGGDNRIGGEPLFVAVGGTVKYHSQHLGLVVAETQAAAERGAALVRATYEHPEHLGKPVITIDDAIKANSYFETSEVLGEGGRVSAGDAAAGLAAAEHKVEGVTYSIPSQYHFYMEPQTAVASADEGGDMLVYSSNQSIEVIQKAVTTVLGLPWHRVTVVTRRVGGGFGGKLTRCQHVAAAAALAAHRLRSKVHVALHRDDDLRTVGGRCELQLRYDVGFDGDGRVMALDMGVRLRGGAYVDISSGDAGAIQGTIDMVYDIPHMSVDVRLCRTNLPPRTPVRGPGTFYACIAIEQVLESVAAALGLDAVAVRERNLLKEPEAPETAVVSALGRRFPPGTYTLPRMWAALKERAEYERRVQEVAEFNKQNAWRKRGISMTPTRWDNFAQRKPAAVSIYPDGSVLVASSGVEIGQGLFTKVAQVAAHELAAVLPANGGRGAGLPLDLIRVADCSTQALPNSGSTGGSTTSESTCQAVALACRKLCANLAPHAAALGENATWQAVVAAAHPAPGDQASGVLLSEYAYYDGKELSGDEHPDSLNYSTFGAAVSEAEIDILTGEVRLQRSDVMFDAGHALNPAVDIGQVEGAFVMGLGLVLAENVDVEPGSGRLLSDSTWTYKVPTAACIPRQLHISLLEDSPHKVGIMSSKATGEPSLFLAVSALAAIQHAISAARRDLGALLPADKQGEAEEAAGPGRSQGVSLEAALATRVPLPANPVNVKEALGPFSVAHILRQALLAA